MNKDFEINSVSELQQAFLDLKNSQANIENILNKLKVSYGALQEGYLSDVSKKIQTSMEECAMKAKKIAENVGIVEQRMNNCISQISSIDDAA